MANIWILIFFYIYKIRFWGFWDYVERFWCHTTLNDVKTAINLCKILRKSLKSRVVVIRKWPIFWIFLNILGLMEAFLTSYDAAQHRTIFYIEKHRNPYIGHFQATKNREFRDFLKIIHKLTSFLTSCSVVCRQTHFKLSQEAQKQIFCIGKHATCCINS